MRKTLALLLLLVAGMIPALAQTEHVQSTEALGIVLEKTGTHNMVREVARHCQAYMGSDNVLTEQEANACALDPSTVYYTGYQHNLRTTGGTDWLAAQMGGAAPGVALYIALTNDAAAAAAGDCAAGSVTCTLASEITLNGLGRAIGAYGHSNGTSTYTVTKAFSASGTQASQKAGLFTASSSGTMVFETVYTAVTVNNGDSLTITWTVTLS